MRPPELNKESNIHTLGEILRFFLILYRKKSLLLEIQQTRLDWQCGTEQRVFSAREKVSVGGEDRTKVTVRKGNPNPTTRDINVPCGARNFTAYDLAASQLNSSSRLRRLDLQLLPSPPNSGQVYTKMNGPILCALLTRLSDLKHSGSPVISCNLKGSTNWCSLTSS